MATEDATSKDENEVADPESADDPPSSPKLQPNEKDEEDAQEATSSLQENTQEPHDFSLEKLSQEIDHFLASPSFKPKDDTEEEEENDTASFEIPKFMDKFLDLVEANIIEHDSAADEKEKWCQEAQEHLQPLLDSIHRISKLSTLITNSELDKENGLLFNRITSIQQRAMVLLEDQLRSLLLHQKPKDLEASTSDVQTSKGKHESEEAVPSESMAKEEEEFPGYPDEVVSNMKLIAKAMISGGFEAECSATYINSRRIHFEEKMGKLGFDKFSIDEVQKMQWDALEKEISNWSNTLRQCANVCFPGEKKVLEIVFSEHTSISRRLFADLLGNILLHLLNFIEAVAMTKRSAEKLFRILDMYEALMDSSSKMDGLCPEEYESEFKSEMIISRTRLGEAAICMFCDLENSIKSDTGKVPVPGGAVHPLTRYVMNYLKYACDYKDILELIFKEYSKTESEGASGSSSGSKSQTGSGSTQDSSLEKQSPLLMQLIKVMELLDASLGAKSKLYKDVSLSNIFLMNNGRYILQKIKGSEVFSKVMGDSWSRKRSSDLRTYHKNYRESWSKVLSVITNHDGLVNHGKIVKPQLKERFKKFNAMFEEIHKTQSQWVVNDEQLQSELRVSISAVMIPAYRSFMARFSQHLDPGRQTEKYIKFQPEDIETYIDDLFDGNSNQKAWRS